MLLGDVLAANSVLNELKKSHQPLTFFLKLEKFDEIVSFINKKKDELINQFSDGTYIYLIKDNTVIKEFKSEDEFLEFELNGDMKIDDSMVVKKVPVILNTLKRESAELDFNLLLSSDIKKYDFTVDKFTVSELKDLTLSYPSFKSLSVLIEK